MPFKIMADVTPERVSWLWPGRIPFGKLTILDGDPGLGKSTLMLDLAARLSVGAALPGGGQHEPMGTIVLMIEDGDADIIQPRLVNAGADLTRIGSLDTITDEAGNGCLPQIPDSIGDIENLVPLVDARLVVIDPIMSYLGEGVNGHRDQDVRRALTPLVAFATRTGCAVVVLRHLNKVAGGEVKYRGQGSIGFIGIARSGLIVAPDPDNPQRSVVASSKSNLGPLPPALAFRLEGCDNGMARVAWEGVSHHTAQSLVMQPPTDEERTALDEAMDWLRDVLGPGPGFAKETQQRAKDAGIAERTLRRAREALGVKIRKASMQDGKWVWSLPQSAPAKVATNLATSPNPEKLATLDILDIFKTESEEVQRGQGVQQNGVGNLANFKGTIPRATITGRGQKCAVCGVPCFAIAGTPLLCREHRGPGLAAD